MRLIKWIFAHYSRSTLAGYSYDFLDCLCFEFYLSAPTSAVRWMWWFLLDFSEKSSNHKGIFAHFILIVWWFDWQWLSTICVEQITTFYPMHRFWKMNAVQCAMYIQSSKQRISLVAVVILNDSFVFIDCTRIMMSLFGFMLIENSKQNFMTF